MSLRDLEAATRRLRAIVGEQWVLAGRLERALYAYDASLAEAMPELVVLPGSTAEVSGVVQAAAQFELAVVPRGAGTSLSGGPVATGGGLVLALNRLRRILSLDRAARTAIVEPGVINTDLQRAAAPHGLCFMPDPASMSIATLGGNAAENAGGPRAVKHGVFGHHVLGLEFVLADGSIVRTGLLSPGTRLPRANLSGIVIGSEGTLAVITQLALALEPLPDQIATVLAFFRAPDDAAAAVAGLAAAGLTPLAAEIMGGLDIRLADEHLGLGLPREASAMLLLEFDGPGPGLARTVARAESVARQSGAMSLQSANDPATRERLWTARRSATGFYGRVKPAFLSGDVTVPRSRVPALFRSVAELATAAGLQVGMVGHAGDGNLHPAVLFDPADTAESAAAHAVNEAIFAAALELGGSITGEHGVGTEKLAFMNQAFASAALEAFRAVKRAFDPQALLNPGKLVPEGGSAPNAADQLSPGPRGGITAARYAPAAGPAAVRRLQSLLGNRMVTSEDQIAAAGFGSPRFRPAALAVPRNLTDLIQAVQAAGSAGVSLYPVGAGKHLHLALPDLREVFAVSTAAMDRVIAIHPADLTTEVMAGCTQASLARALAAIATAGGPRLRYPLAAWRPAGATLGSEAAMDLPGPGPWHPRPTRHFVAGITYVDASGNPCRVGASTVKDVAGYDLTRLLCGSWGVFGIIAALTLRLEPAPEFEAILRARFPGNDVNRAAAFAATVKALFPLDFALPGARRAARHVDIIISIGGLGEDVNYLEAQAGDLARLHGAELSRLAGRAALLARNSCLRRFAAESAAEVAWRDGLPVDPGDGNDALNRLLLALKQELDPRWLYSPARLDAAQ